MPIIIKGGKAIPKENNKKYNSFGNEICMIFAIRLVITSE
jgi:hypothetical protein